MGKVMAVNISVKRGTQKLNVHTVKLIENYGLEKADLLGENIAEVKEVIGGRIEEAILRDERFNSVEIESISNYRNELMVSLTVTTSDDEEIEVEGVSIDV